MTPHFETPAMRELRWERERRLAGDVLCWAKPRWHYRPFERDHVEPLGAYGLSREMKRLALRLQKKEPRTLTVEGERFQVRQQWDRQQYQAWLMRKRGAIYHVIAEALGVSPSRARQMVYKQNRLQIHRWRWQQDPTTMRGDSPIHTEPWTD